MCLKDLDLSNNKLATVAELEPLKGLPLESLDVVSCPLETEKDYEKKIFELLKGLKYLNRKNKEGEGNVFNISWVVQVL